ncbi:hypothetical protein C3K47_06190 [Solitalea longa]|uniref:Porin n=2 Tax=Solitalea longa TaxID=2079460 RepID=A0A2S5A5J1_9SPHI|nr:hypothetical protein C3K47_06190 [Solitalea longa]
MRLFAQQQELPNVLEIAGTVMSDMGYNFNQINPDYFDVMRPTQLPAHKNQYGTDGNVFFGVRQSFFGVRSIIQTPLGTLNARFAFDLFGTGNNAGRTAFHMIFAYVELGKIGVGHNWSLFSDIDGYPNIVEYWGPVGLSLCKNVQLRFIPLSGRNRLAFALESPGASADQGIYRDRIELDDIKPKFNLPDLSAEFRVTRNWGYAELAGIIRKIAWEDQGEEPYDFTGHAIGWGFNLSTNLKLGKKSLFVGQTVIGEGIENNMNDAPTDIGIKNNFSNPVSPLKGVPLPLYSYSAYINHQWNNKFSSVIGYSGIIVDNSDGQAPDAFHKGSYASTNLLYYPIPNVTAGVELQWINRKNYQDGWETSATKIQISFKYSFRHEFKFKQE